MTPEPAETKAAIELVKPLMEAVKTVLETVRSPAERSEKTSGTRSGPLQVMGRLYIGLTAILALSASVAAYMDMQIVTSNVSVITCILRCSLLTACLAGLIGTVVLVGFLAKRSPSLLSSPTEYAHTVHDRLMDRGDQGTPKSTHSKASTGEKLPPLDTTTGDGKKAI